MSATDSVESSQEESDLQPLVPGPREEWDFEEMDTAPCGKPRPDMPLPTDQAQLAADSQDILPVPQEATPGTAVDHLDTFLIRHHRYLENSSPSYRRLADHSKAQLVEKELGKKFNGFMQKHQTDSNPYEDICAFYQSFLSKCDGLYEQVRDGIQIPKTTLAKCLLGCPLGKSATQNQAIQAHKQLLKENKCKEYSNFCKELGETLFQEEMLSEFRKYKARHAKLSDEQVKDFVQRNFADLNLMTDNFV